MKKLLFALIALFVINVSTFAQAKPAAKSAAPAKMEVIKKAEPAKVVAMDKAKPAATKGAVVLKADGTPDKRYKNAPATKGPVKKDGTPDKRYKANK